MNKLAYLLVSSVALLVFACGGAPEPPPEASAPVIVPPGAQLELLFTRSLPLVGGLTEGAAAAPDGRIYFSDISFGEVLGKIMRYDPATGETDVFAEDSGKSNGLIFDAEGFLVAAEGAENGGRQISRYDVETGEKTTVADNYEGKRFNSPNDLTIDAQGRIYFSDPRYLGSEGRELEYMAVYRIDTDGSVVEVTHEAEKPNGVALSPDGSTLYVADHNNGGENISDPEAPAAVQGAMRVYAFPLGDDGLVNGPRRTLVEFGSEVGCDGMTVDEHGNIYLSSRSLKRPGVLIINPEGQEVGFIATGPENQLDPAAAQGIPSNVEFSVGDDSNMLYVTVDTSLYRIPLGVEGYRPY
ncbi:MAG: SMP-30/gluconolactonase/LRE family protein [Acidobacteria bacterium]|nr:SMP-30/gluconolactonase/LRE family protein [Acidobacteriota bacterium]